MADSLLRPRGMVIMAALWNGPMAVGRCAGGRGFAAGAALGRVLLADRPGRPTHLFGHCWRSM
jgi:hypothetical protein